MNFGYLKIIFLKNSQTENKGGLFEKQFRNERAIRKKEETGYVDTQSAARQVATRRVVDTLTWALCGKPRWRSACSADRMARGYSCARTTQISSPNNLDQTVRMFSIKQTKLVSQISTIGQLSSPHVDRHERPRLNDERYLNLHSAGLPNPSR